MMVLFQCLWFCTKMKHEKSVDLYNDVCEMEQSYGAISHIINNN